MATSTPAAGDKSLFWATGLMLFALFFGAGNLIFPAAMGQQAGEHIVSAMLGFMLTGAGLPLLGVAAIGYSGVDVNTDTLRMWLGDVLVAEEGGRAASYTEEAGQRVMNEAEITVRIDLRSGRESATVYTCDLSKEYVAINADYRS